MRPGVKRKRDRTEGRIALRVDLMNIGYHLEAAADALRLATVDARTLGVVDELAIATKALRAIANTKTTDNRSRGLALAALEKMRVTP